MKRSYLSALEKWMVNPRRKPLMVWGARQVGKTYLLKDLFAETYFPGRYIYIDCIADTEFASFIDERPNLKSLLMFLQRRVDFQISSQTLIIFDEIQYSLWLFGLLKYFAQDRPDIPVICTGSLVRCKLAISSKRKKTKENFLYPVGKFSSLSVYPLNFEEYLLNTDPDLLELIRESYRKFSPLPNPIHNEAMSALNDYLSIGGMPEILSAKLSGAPKEDILEISHQIFDNYIGDMAFYQMSTQSVVRSRLLYRNAVRLLGRESRKFSPSVLEKGSTKRNFRGPIDWLTSADTLLKSEQLKETVTLPLAPDLSENFRFYLSDPGMFLIEADIDTESILNGDKNTLSGAFFENYIAIEMRKCGLPLYFWKSKRDAEFEFILQVNGNVIPIDVKKSRGPLNSLQPFASRNKFAIAIKISQASLGYDFRKRILSIPLYMAFCLFKDIGEGTFKLSNYVSE